ncbi:hypothetical protein RND71_009035 [Anisodus tanguticus]|uniref:Uncharacterized protein n=1 Tax=Anisodus tanguticus TaxID=243964 RepID=A0AAE1SQ27_9SOLA|nr:hypothetical protein RND71_009035 [Anisodus tanguticus]
MGNCIDTLLSPSLNQEDEELNDLANDTKLGLSDEEVQYYVIQQVFEQCHSPRCLSNVNDSCKNKRIKIVLSKQQLKVLVNNVKELQCGQISVQSLIDKEDCKRWKPSLDTIPEL